jgi:hypothetical protein
MPFEQGSTDLLARGFYIEQSFSKADSHSPSPDILNCIWSATVHKILQSLMPHESNPHLHILQPAAESLANDAIQLPDRDQNVNLPNNPFTLKMQYVFITRGIYPAK